MNIENLDEVAKANGIEVPRLRGYRLMRNQHVWTGEEIAKEIVEELDHTYRSLCDIAVRMAEDAMEHDLGAYGADKSCLSLYERQCGGFEKRFRAQIEMWNRYAGRDDVLFIHSRMGYPLESHWDSKNKETVVDRDLRNEPWFLDWVPDAYDETYIDIYARIDPSKLPKGEGE